MNGAAVDFVPNPDPATVSVDPCDNVPDTLSIANPALLGLGLGLTDEDGDGDRDGDRDTDEDGDGEGDVDADADVEGLCDGLDA